jgi:hypothetical protein
VGQEITMNTTARTVARLAAAVAVAAIVLPAGAAEAKRKKSRKRAVAAPAVAAPAVAEAPRSFNEQLGLGIELVVPSGRKAAAAPVDLAARAAQSEGYDLSRLDDRMVAAPSGEADVRMAAVTLTQAQVGAVVRGRGGDIQYCWSTVPAAERTDRTVTLEVTVVADGTLDAVAFGEGAPAAFVACLAKAATAWTFPVADATSVVEYPLVLRSH